MTFKNAKVAKIGKGVFFQIELTAKISFGTEIDENGLARWLSWLRHSAHRPVWSVGGAGVQSPGRPVDFVFGFQGRML